MTGYVEAALIDAYPGLTNIAGGHGNSAFGSMHANQIVERYTAREMEFHHKILLINVNRTAAEFDLYHATQHAWKLDVERAARADYVVAIVQGLGVGVFRPEKWLKATEENFPGRKKVEGRYGFIGSPAQQEVRDMYVGTRTPEDYRKRGASNPIKYTYQ